MNASPFPDTRVRTTCPYCGVGCGIEARLAGVEAEISGDPNHPANFGRLCSKGSALGETLGLTTRLLHPMVGGQRVSWDAALDLVARRFGDTLREHGPDAVAFYVSGQLLTEDYYLANKLIKGFMGSANIDTNSRLCMSSAVAGHKRAFGEDIVPGCYEDFDLADLAVLVGSNTAWCHPVLYQRLLAARAKRGTRIVTIDPRQTATAEDADLHIALKPGTDVRLFNALFVELVSRGAIDRAYVAARTSGFEEALERARECDPSVGAVARDCGVEEEVIETFFDWFFAHQRTVTAFSQGVNQSTRGTDKVNAIINCHLATGRIGKPGMGPFSLTGQPNAMGGREVGGLANQLAAHMDLADEADRKRVAAFWGTDNLASQPGLKAVDMFRAVADGRIRAIWIMGTNPAVSLPDAASVRAALKACDFAVVSDCVAHTDTMGFAPVALPAAAWGEKDGTVTNSERRISRQRSFLAPPGEAMADWRIVTEVAHRMGFGHAFAYSKPSQIFREHAALSHCENAGRRAFDIGGLAHLTDAAYDALEPVQWPVPAKGGQGTARVLGDGRFFTADGRARFVPITPHGPAHKTDKTYPFALNSGRVRDQWHTMTRTGLSPRLSQHAPEPFVAMSAKDAERLGLVEGALAKVSSRWGSGIYRVVLSAGQRDSEVFVPMHWTDTVAANAVAGRLVNPAVDPVSGQPEFKHTPVEVAPAQAAWRGFLLTCNEISRPPCSYWARITVEGGFLYELAGTGEGSMMPTLAMLAGEASAQCEHIEVTNLKRRDYRVARLENERLTHCLILTRSGDLPPRAWLTGLLGAARITDAERATLLSGRPASGEPDETPLVCACFRVSLGKIRTAIRNDHLASVESVGARLGAGTNCGSCRPEIRAILAEATPQRV